MTMDELFAKLSSPEFQDTENSDIYYNYYLFQYDADKETDIEAELKEFKDRLRRPTQYIDVLSLDLFEEFCNYLDTISFGPSGSYLQYLLEQDKDASKSDAVTSILSDEANKAGFYQYIHKRILEHLDKDGDGMHRPYIFFYGIGKIYPYLRTNVLLTNYERYNETSRYKIIIFYPGKQANNSYSLFGCLTDAHAYRATLLINA